MSAEFDKLLTCMRKIIPAIDDHKNVVMELWISSFETNRDIISNFKLLKTQTETEKGENYTFKARAYGTVIKFVESYPYPIIDTKPFKNVRGIGPKSIVKIDEIIKSGKLSLLAPNHDRLQVLATFEKILGVGPAKALELYSLGYRKLSDIDKTKLTYSQQIGLEYFDELNQKISRSSIDAIKPVLYNFAKNIDYDIKFELVGSYRRGAEFSSDIDVMLSSKNFDKKLSRLLISKFVEQLIDNNILTHKINQGDNKFTGIIIDNQGIHRQLDIWSVYLASWDAALFSLTGPDSFNRKMRQHAKDKGYKLSEYYLERLSDNYKIYPTSERDIFDYLKLDYISPDERK